MRRTVVKKRDDWSSVEGGFGPEYRREIANAQKRAKLRRTVTAAIAITFAVLCVVQIIFNRLHAQAYDAALKNGEECGLLSKHIDAVVTKQNILWHPRYTADAATTQVIRTREVSTICDKVKVRIRQKNVTIRHLFGDLNALPPLSVCLMHFSDYFNNSLGCA